jgi:hypothetical protein
MSQSIENVKVENEVVEVEVAQVVELPVEALERIGGGVVGFTL